MIPKKRLYLFLSAIVLIGLLLRVYCSKDPYLHKWDERYHALVAKNIIDSPIKPTLYSEPILDYNPSDWTHNHVWLHKQPMSLWLMSGSIYLFGVNEFSVRLPSIVLGTLSFLLVFMMARWFYNDKVGLIACFLMAVNGKVIELVSGRTATDHVDTIFMFFIFLSVWLAILFAQNRKLIFNILCGFTLGLAILTKWLPALIVLPVWVLLVYKSSEKDFKYVLVNFILLIIIVVCVALPWQLYIHNAFPVEAEWESNFNTAHFSEGIEGHGKPFYYHFDIMRIMFGELIYLPVLWFVWKTFKRTSIDKVNLIMWLFIPYFIFTIAATKMPAYTMIASPVIFTITGVFVMYLWSIREMLKFKWLSHLLIFFLIALPVRYCFERVKLFQNDVEVDNHYEKMRNQAIIFARSMKKELVFNEPNYIEMMFYSDVVAYDYLPNKEVLDSLVISGNPVYIFDEDFSPLYKLHEINQ